MMRLVCQDVIQVDLHCRLRRAEQQQRNHCDVEQPGAHCWNRAVGRQPVSETLRLPIIIFPTENDVLT